MYPRGGACTVTVAYPTNGFAAEKDIPKVVSDGKINPKNIFFVLFAQNSFYCQKQRKTNSLSVVGCKRTPTILSGVVLPSKQTKALYHIT